MEGQIESRVSEKEANIPPSPVQLDLLRKREDLMLSRTRVLHDIEAARNPRYKQMLNAALAHLEHELARL